MKKINIIMCTSIFIIMLTSISLARPGGGGSSGGGSSSGGSSSGGHGSSSYNRSNTNPTASAVTSLAMTGVMISISRTNTIICRFKVMKKEKECNSVIKEISLYNSNYSLNKIYKDVSDTFYIQAKAWANMDQDISIDYSTSKLYNNHRTKLQWMSVRNERNILKKEKLISMRVIGIDSNKNENIESIWIAIKGSMIDYIEKNGEITEGNKYIAKPYVEYWKFDSIDGRWLLDEIKQEGDLFELEQIGTIRIE